MLDTILSITVLEFAALVVLLPAFGGLVGYLVAGDRMRRAAGGRTPAELREELETYREDVTSHFQETAELLDGMTAQYRAVYTHMAQGAQTLCDAEGSGPRLEQLRAGLLDPPAAEFDEPDDERIVDDEAPVDDEEDDPRDPEGIVPATGAGRAGVAPRD